MRLTTVILIATFIQVSASTYGQRITINERKASFETILKSIRTQSGYDVLMDRTILKKTGTVNVSIKDATIDEAMKSLLSGLPLKYTIDGKIVVIEENSSSFIDKVIARFQAIDVYGRVIDENGSALVGATVRVKNGKGSAITGNDGRFSIKGVENDAVLVISYLGYVNKEINAGSDLTGIVMVLSDSKLDEVQVIAYGTTSQRFNVGNVASVKAVDIEKQPVNNPILALAGRVPGLQITQSTGMSGGGVKVSIQGQNSAIMGNDPFYVIDGVPYSAQLLPNLGSILGTSSTGGPYGATGNPFSFINPSDIESIEILKDASATAIYGSRASNGAILITTKKGNAEKTQVTFNFDNGFGKVANKLNLLNTEQYLEVRKEAFKNDGVAIPNNASIQDGSNYDLTLWDQHKYTDWQEKLIGGNAQYNSAQVSISGGNASTQFLINSSFHRETTVFPGDFADHKGSMHFSLNHISDNGKFRVGVSNSYLIDNNKLLSADLTNDAITLPPNAPDLRTGDGSINWAPDNLGNPSYLNINPLSKTVNTYQVKNYNLIGNVNLSYEVFKGLQLKTNLGYTSLKSDEAQYTFPGSAPPEYAQFQPRKAVYGDNMAMTWIAEPQISYTAQAFKGQLSVLLGSTFQRSKSHRQVLEATGFTTDLAMENIGAASSVIVPGFSTIETIYKYNAIFGRVNYNWQDKYIADFTLRRDGSSRFGSENSLNNFGAIGMGWVFTNEKFLKDRFDLLSFGKLKASYGTTGNDQIGDYMFLALYTPNNQPVPYLGGNALQPMGLSNPYLQWESTRKLNLGLELGLLKDRILLSTNYAINRSSNQLLRTSLPKTTGPSGIFTNLPATIQNTSLEFALNTNNITRPLFSWSTNINLTIPKNKVVEFNGLETSLYKDQYVVGQPINVLRLYNYQGIDPVTGLYLFMDKNGVKSSNDPARDKENRAINIDPNPTFYGGISNTISIKGFQLDVLFQFVKQIGMSYAYGTGSTGYFMSNQPTSVLDRWQAPGDEGKRVQKYTATKFGDLNPALYLVNTQAVYADASYIRLKNVSLSWTVPEKWVSRAKVRRCMLFIHGQNLWTMTNYTGLDPESRSSFTLPPLATLTFGAKITL